MHEIWTKMEFYCTGKTENYKQKQSLIRYFSQSSLAERVLGPKLPVGRISGYGIRFVQISIFLFFSTDLVSLGLHKRTGKLFDCEQKRGSSL